MLDDLKGEAEEIAKVSPWITCRPPPHTRTRQRARLSTPPAVSRYGPPLHAAREFGCRNKLFDLLDEQALVPSQVKQCCEAILGCGALPEPEADLAAFRAAVEESLGGVTPVFDPVTKAMRPWVDPERLCKKKKDGCCIM